MVLDVPLELMLRLSACWSSFGECISISGKVTFQLGLVPEPDCDPVVLLESLAKTNAGGLVTFRVFIDDFFVKPAAECKAGFKMTVFAEGCISKAVDVDSKGSDVVFIFLSCIKY